MRELNPARQQVLMYHSVDDFAEDPYLITVRPRRFAGQMAWLTSRELRGVSMRELRDAQSSGAARQLVGLTFDDGYADFAVHALPVLLDHGFTATVFVVSDLVGGVNEWDPAGPRKRLMNAAQLREISALGMEVGSHAKTHRSLYGMPSGELHLEVKASRADLEELLDEEVTGLAYPYGHADEAAIEATRAAGYAYACGIKPRRADPHCLPRTHIGERDRWLRVTAKRFLYQWQWCR